TTVGRFRVLRFFDSLWIAARRNHVEWGRDDATQDLPKLRPYRQIGSQLGVADTEFLLDQFHPRRRQVSPLLPPLVNVLTIAIIIGATLGRSLVERLGLPWFQRCFRLC